MNTKKQFEPTEFLPLHPLLRKVLEGHTTADDDYEKAKDRASRYANTLENDIEFGVIGTRIGGSTGKGTAIAPYSDIDLYVYLDQSSFLNQRGQPLSPEGVLQRMEERLARRLTFEIDRNYADLRPQRHSVGIRYKKEGSIGIDVVPAMCRGNRTDVVVIPRRTPEGWVPTSVERQIALIESMDVQYRPLRRGIRLLKLWNRQEQAKLPAYALEVLAFHAVKNGCPLGETEVFVSVLDFLGHSNLEEVVHVDTHHRRPQWSQLPAIYDPAMPDNNLIEGWSMGDGARIGSTARSTLAKLRKALRFGSGDRPDLEAACLAEALSGEWDNEPRTVVYRNLLGF